MPGARSVPIPMARRRSTMRGSTISRRSRRVNESADEDLDYRPDAGVAVPGAVSGRAAETEDRGRGRYLRRSSVDGQECDGDARRRCEAGGIDLFRTADRRRVGRAVAGRGVDTYRHHATQRRAARRRSVDLTRYERTEEHTSE